MSFEQARHLVEQHAFGLSPTGEETLELLAAAGRVLAEDICADRDFPPFDRATRDGYALRAEDLSDPPMRLAIAGEARAGEVGAVAVGRGEAIRIMTGAPMPAGADAVVMVEHTAEVDAAGKGVEVRRRVSAGDNFVPRGAEARRGQTLLSRGRKLDQGGIAIAAAVGKNRIQVFRKPRVAVLSTGDELVAIDANPGPAQIRNSNSFSLAVQVQAAGGEAVRLAVAPDERIRLRELVEEGLQFDLLLLTGGVSMGKYDLVEQVLGELQPEFYFTGAEIQPGRPVVFGSVPNRGESGRRYFFGLPGNPVSTMVTFELFARAMIEGLSGMRPQPLVFLSARLKAAIETKVGLKRFLPAVLSGEFERAEVELARWQGSGDIAALARANCYVVIPPDRERLAAGEWVGLLLR